MKQPTTRQLIVELQLVKLQLNAYWSADPKIATLQFQSLNDRVRVIKRILRERNVTI